MPVERVTTETSRRFAATRAIRATGTAAIAAGWLLAPPLASPASADPTVRCMARIIADVAAEEAPEEVKSKSNGAFGPLTQVKIDKVTGRMVYCARNSYCYWSNAFDITTPCRLKRDESHADARYFSYSAR